MGSGNGIKYWRSWWCKACEWLALFLIFPPHAPSSVMAEAAGRNGGAGRVDGGWGGSTGKTVEMCLLRVTSGSPPPPLLMCHVTDGVSLYYVLVSAVGKLPPWKPPESGREQTALCSAWCRGARGVFHSWLTLGWSLLLWWPRLLLTHVVDRAVGPMGALHVLEPWAKF